MEKMNQLIITEEINKCLLCYNASCDKACSHNQSPANFIRSLKFDNNYGAIIDKEVCKNCTGDCEKACVHYNSPIKIKKIIEDFNPNTLDTTNVSLAIDFCGIKCENPFFLSSSIVAADYEMCAKALKLGFAGVVFKTIGFIKPKEVSPRFDSITSGNTSFLGFKNLEQISEHDLYDNLAILKRLKTDFPTKVIVASIMGSNEEEWYELSKLATQANVDIIECNFSCPHMAENGVGSAVGESEFYVEKYTKAVRRGTTLPILAKMTPNITDMTVPAIAAINGGATGLAAINTIKSLSGFDVESLTPSHDVAGLTSISGYSGMAVKPIAMRFICDMATNEILKNYPISGMGGITTWKDSIDFILLGASNIQITTSVMEFGYRIIDDLISGLKQYMARHNIKSLSSLVGVGLKDVVSTQALNRNTIIYPVINQSECVGCGRCYVSCYDGGHQAISFIDGKAKIIGSKCVGCHLCMLVCPSKAISKSKRILKGNN